LLTAAAVVYDKTSDVGFYRDEWDYVLNRRGTSFDTFLEPHNDHLTALPVALFRVLLETVGTTPHWAYVTLIVLANAAVGVLVFAIGRRRVGDVPALCATAVVVLYGPGHEDLLLPFQITLVGSLAAGMGMLLALEQRRDVLAAALLTVSLACSAAAIPFVLAAVVELALGEDRRQRLVRVLAVPLVLYGLWYLAYGQSQAKAENAYATLEYAAGLVSNSLGGAVGLGPAWGPPLTIALAAGTAYALTRPGVPPRTVSMFVLAVSYPLLTGLARADVAPPDAPRYLYPTLVLALLLLFELLRGRRLRLAGSLLLAAFTLAVVLANVDIIRKEAIYKAETSFVRARLAALELAEGRVDPAFQPDPQRASPVRAGPYLSAVADYGSPAYSVEELLAQPPPQREEADGVLLAATGFGLGPAPPCESFERVSPDAGLELEAPAPRVVARAGRAPVEVRVRRFGDAFTPAPTAVVEPGQASEVRLAADRAPTPWKVRLSSDQAFGVCRLG
jgi:hypothetical protein